MTAWLTPELVAAVGGMIPPAAGTPDATALEADVAAVVAYVQRKRPDIVWTADPLVVGDDMVLGAAMLAQRYYQRRNSPLGTVGSPELGLSTILRLDPDVADLLKIGPGRGFAFASGTDTTDPWDSRYVPPVTP